MFLFPTSGSCSFVFYVFEMSKNLTVDVFGEIDFCKFFQTFEETELFRRSEYFSFSLTFPFQGQGFMHMCFWTAARHSHRLHFFNY